MPKKTDADGSANQEDDIAKAIRILTEDRQQRIEACMQEIQTVLDKYGFDLAVNPSITLVPKSSPTANKHE